MEVTYYKAVKKKGGRKMFIFLCILTFIVFFVLGASSKEILKPSWSKEYDVELTDEIGTLHTDLSYGEKQSNKFDMYLPKDNTRENYGLVVYLHAGGFTSGDKADDKKMLSWLCSKGYVAVGINYTLFNEENPNANVYTQSLEIKEAIPKVIEEAEKKGYHINEMAISGGSAGHALAMIYAYRDVNTSPVPVKLLFGSVGPSSFYAEDWDIYGFDKNTDKSRKEASTLLGIMGGVQLTPEMIENGSYIDKLQHISSVMWINKDTVPSVVAYGKYDKIQPYKGSQRLLKAYKENNVDFQFFACSLSGHRLQNDSRIYKKYMQSVTEYLDKYLPIKK